MSGDIFTLPPPARMPREMYVNTLSVDKLKDFYVKAGQKKPAKKTRKTTTRRAYSGASRAGRGRGTNYVTITGNGEYYPVPPAYHDPRARLDLEKTYAFDPTYGQRLGATLGEGVQSFAKALGFGEYNIQSNSMCSEKWIDMGTSPPKVKNTSRGEATVFSHREYLGDLFTGAGTPSAFNLLQYSINPGNSTLFPFCSRIAENFQEWEVRGMLVELKSLCSETSTTLSLGSMFCAVDYNSLDLPPTNKTELENMEYACSNKPSSSILMPVECKLSNDVLTHLYTAVDDDYQGGDPRLYDLGKLFVGTFGCPAAAAPVAEIWITYEIAFFKPHIHEEEPEILTLTASTHFTGLTPVTPAFPLGSPVREEGGDLGFDVTNSVSSSLVVLPAQDETSVYLVSLWWRTQGTITAPDAPVITPNPGTSVVSNFWSGIAGNSAQTYAFTPASPLISADSFSLNFIVEVEAATVGEFNLSGGVITSATQPSYWDLVISRCNNTQQLKSARQFKRGLKKHHK